MILYTHDLWPDVTTYRPTVGEQIRAGLTYREHQQSAHLWAYQFGDISVIEVQQDVPSGATWLEVLGGEPIDAYQTEVAVECATEDGPGRPDLGAYRIATAVGTTITLEVRLRGVGVEALVMLAVDGAAPVELRLGTLANADDSYPSRRFVRLALDVDDSVVVWVQEVRAFSGDGYLDQIEITPCRFGGDAPIDSTASPIATVATMPSGMDYPTLGGDVVIGARDPAVGEILAGPLLIGTHMPLWPASDLTHDVVGYAPGSQWEAIDGDFVFERLSGPSSHVAAVLANGATYTPSSAPLALGDAWVFSLAIAPDDVPRSSLGGIWSTDTAFIRLLDAAGPQREIWASNDASLGEWSPGEWLDVTVAWVPSDTVPGDASVFFWLNGDLVVSYTDSDAAAGVLQLGSGNMGGQDMFAWPVLMRRQRDELGTLSEILGYVESWLGWRGMMTGIF